MARWIPNHERSGCTISLRGSYHLPFAKMVSERGFTCVRQFYGRGRTRQRLTTLIHQTFTSPKYHRIVLVPRHVSTGEICQEYFQERPLCQSLQKSERSIRRQEFTASSFSTYWQDVMDVYQKVIERPFGYMVLDLHPASDDRICVLSHLLTHEGFLRCYQRKRAEINILKSTSIRLGSFKASCLG